MSQSLASGGRLVVAAAGATTAALVGLLVGRGDERLALSLVASLAVGFALMVAPNAVVLLGAFLVYARAYSAAGVPLPEIGALLMVLGISVGNRGRWRLPPSLLVAAMLLLTWLGYVAFDQIGQATVQKRLTSLILWLALVVAVAVAGSAKRWIAWGLLVGLLASAPAGLLLGSAYGSRWAGLVGDPNTYGLTVAVTLPLITYGLKIPKRWSLALWLFGAAMVVMADSRTSMLALGTAAAVYLLLPYARAWAVGVPVLALWIGSSLPDTVVRGGRWEDRLGSDELRIRIDEASTRQIQENLWTGRTLGEGKVDLALYGDPPQNLEFYLHNSYKSLVTETGLVGVCLYAVLVLGAVWHGLRGTIERGALAGIGAAAVMATQLGEVLFTIPVALALGMAWGSSLGAPPREPTSPTRGQASHSDAVVAA